MSASEPPAERGDRARTTMGTEMSASEPPAERGDRARTTMGAEMSASEPPAEVNLALRYAARSHIGLVRTGNEDSGYAGPSMLVVADGMGGHAAGELASAAAVALFAEIDAEADHTNEPDVLTDLAGGVTKTTEQIRRVVGDQPQYSGMGTTLTAVVWRQGVINVAHVGDSRAYLLRDGELSQMTHDHTYVQMLVDTGRITPREALTHARRNLLLRAIDGVNDVEPDLQAREARVGDRYLLCSDGLCGVVPEGRLATLLAEGDPTHAVTALVDAALELGAPDNVTVVVADVIEVDATEAAAIASAEPVVVGAASETRNRERLATVAFPSDVEPELRPEPELATPAKPQELELSGNSDSVERAGRLARWWPVLAIGGVVIALAAATTVLSLWARSQYFVGDDGGFVAIYQGVSQNVGGRPLSSVNERSTVAVTALPDVDQAAVLNTIPAADLAEAQRIVSRLSAQAASCSTAPTQGCPTAPTPSATAFTPSPALPSPAPSGSIR